MAPIKPIDDLVIQVRRLIGTVNGLLERFARGYEELDNIRLALEEQRELIKDLIVESSRQADSHNKKMDRLEQYVVLRGMGAVGRETLQIEDSVHKEHLEKALSEELSRQQGLVRQYQKNISIVQEQVAKYGETVSRLNELEEYQSKLDKALEAMNRIREQLQ